VMNPKKESLSGLEDLNRAQARSDRIRSESDLHPREASGTEVLVYAAIASSTLSRRA
jgi:hypothetical protein